MGSLGFPEIMLLVLVALFVNYLNSLQRFLEKCSPESRAVSPRSVWLMMIPFFNWIWHFVLVIKISKTVHNELTRRNLPDTESESSERLGIIMCTLGVLAGLVVGRISSNSFGAIEPVPAICVSAFLVWWVIYWRKVTACSKLLDDSEVGQGRPISGKPVPAKGVWWWAACVVLESSFVLLPTGAKAVPAYGLALSIPIALIALAVCYWWYSQSKLLPRRASFLRFVGYLLFGLGTMFATGRGIAFATSGAEHPARGAMIICICLAMIAGSYFLVFERRSAQQTSRQEPAGISNTG